MNKAPVVEIFESIQGEGFSIGHPAIFVRFWGCNLRCQFNGESCDTVYAVKTEKDKAHLMTAAEIAVKIKEFKADRVIFTGGEPLLYQDLICEVIDIVDDISGFKFFEIETNGTIKPSNDLMNRIYIFNVSPKLSNSNQEDGFDHKRISLEAISSFNSTHSCFKFVISKKEDMNEIMPLLPLLDDLPVYLMPEGVCKENISAIAPMVVDLCLKHGFIYSPREHITIWGGKRGR